MLQQFLQDCIFVLVGKSEWNSPLEVVLLTGGWITQDPANIGKYRSGR